MEMRLEHLLDLIPRMRLRDHHELSGLISQPLAVWAIARSRDPGVAYTFTYDGKIVAVGGVLEGAVRGIGAGWALATDNWWRVLSHVKDVWAMFLEHGEYRRIECKCYADNEAANRFALHLGFKLEGRLRAYTLRGEDVNQYGMVTGG